MPSLSYSLIKRLEPLHSSQTPVLRRIAALTLNSFEDDLRAAAISSGSAFFGTYTSPGRVIRVDTVDLTRVAGVTLNAGEEKLVSATIAADVFLYMSTDTSVRFSRTAPALERSDEPNVFILGGSQPAKIIKLDISGNSVSRVGALTLSTGFDFVRALTSYEGYLMAHTYTSLAMAYLDCHIYAGRTKLNDRQHPFHSDRNDGL